MAPTESHDDDNEVRNAAFRASGDDQTSARPQARETRKLARQAGILTGVPAVLVAGPLVGVLLGKFLDARFGTSPWLLLACLVLGFIAAGREVIRMLRLSSEDVETPEDAKPPATIKPPAHDDSSRREP